MNSHLHTFRTGNPIVARTTETFVEHVMIGGERKRMEFERPIIWLMESETRLIYRAPSRKGQPITTSMAH
jgi:hypothetical protein